MRTKILLLGGTGRIGSAVAHFLVPNKDVALITIMTRSPDSAAKLLSGLGPKAEFSRGNATDRDETARLASASDIVLNCAGPEGTVVLPVLQAALRASTNYADIGGDPEVTKRALRLSARAVSSGITAVVGIGSGPGLLNLMIRHAAEQMDGAIEITSCLFLPLAAGSWSDPLKLLERMKSSGRVDPGWQTMMKWADKSCRVYRRRRLVNISPLTNVREMITPKGFKIMAFPISTSEPITVPRFVSRIERLECLLSLFPPQLNELYFGLGGQLSEGEIDEAEAVLGFFETIAGNKKRWLDTRAFGIRKPLVWVEATGLKDGYKAKYVCWPDMSWFSAARALSVATLRILRGDVRTKGVFPPEACFEPMRFFDDVARIDGSRLAKNRPLHSRWIAVS